MGGFFKGEGELMGFLIGGFLLLWLKPNRPNSHDTEVMRITKMALSRLKLKKTVVEKRAKSCSTHDSITLFRVAGLRTTPTSLPPLRGAACALSRCFCAAEKAAYLNPKV